MNLKKWVMAILNKVTKKEETNNTEITLTKEELEFLLNTIAKSTFNGKDVQLVYDVAVKLQKTILDKM
jgi:hypothetical protein